ncbi:MAG: T9SS type A sorting domain-containing protein [Bacteroidia bacterium]
MKNIFTGFILLFTCFASFAQTLSIHCETGTESDGLQYVYVYGENLTAQDQTIGAMTFLLAHQQYQQWQATQSWALADAKWGTQIVRKEDIAQVTGYGVGFSEVYRDARAAGQQDDPMHIPAHTKMLLSRIAFTSSPLGEGVYLIGPQEDKLVSISDAEGAAVNFTVTGQPVVAGLPVELIEFKAEQIGDKRAEIRWTSQLETQTDYYVVEKSLDGLAFEALAEEDATGPGSYKTVDESPFLPFTYYRLRWRDTDGETGITETLLVQFSETANRMKVFPNPSNGKMSLQVERSLQEFTSLSLYNAAGKQVWETTNMPNSYTIELDFADFPKGIYWLRGLGLKGENIAVSLLIE